MVTGVTEPLQNIVPKFFPVSQPSITEREISNVTDAVRSGWVSSLGSYIDDFETSFAQYCGVEFAVATSNGTTALHLAIEALSIGPGHEVIVPDLTFVATANAVAYSGATPVLVDVDTDTLCINPEAVRRAITPKSRAVIPVHLYGHPAEMEEINAIAAEFDLFVIEDAAEAHGAEFRGKRVGGLSNCGVFSFYGNKIITTGEGGMITTNDAALYQRARSLRDHAMSPTRRYWHAEMGFNYRMSNLQAALGMAQLERIDEILKHRRDLMGWYRESITTTEEVRLNYVAEWASSAYWMICLEIDWLDDKLRDKLMGELKKNGVDSRPYFCTVSSMPMYEMVPCRVAWRKAGIGLNLPTYFDLTRNDVSTIGAVVNDLLIRLGPR